MNARLITLCLAFTAIAAVAAERSPAPAAAPAAAAPLELKIEQLDGATFDLAAHRGHWVVVNYWATWCAPCLKEMPDLDELDARREDLVVIGLAFEEIEAAELRAFLKQRPVKYAIALVDPYAPPKAFDVPRGLPTTYLIAPDGTVAHKFLGPVTAKEIEAAIGSAAKPAADA